MSSSEHEYEPPRGSDVPDSQVGTHIDRLAVVESHDEQPDVNGLDEAGRPSQEARRIPSSSRRRPQSKQSGLKSDQEPGLRPKKRGPKSRGSAKSANWMGSIGSWFGVSNGVSAVGQDVAVDLGTANTLVYVRGEGIVLAEPSVVAIDDRTGSIVAVGRKAKEMLGRTPDGISAIRPLKDGVVADFETTERMLRYFLQQVHTRKLLIKPRLVICVPSGITAVEQRAVKDAGYAAGSRRVYVVEEPMAAAIGAGLRVHDAAGSMVVDVGGGTTEVAVISLGGIVTSMSARVGGNRLDEAIVTYVKKEYSLLLGDHTAEKIKIQLGSAFPTGEEPQAEVRGRDLISGLPRNVVLTSKEVRKAIDEPIKAIVDTVRTILDRTPPELAGDIMDRGIVLTGGGAQLRGLDQRLRHETGMPVYVAEYPADCVALGTGRCVEDFEALKPILLAESRY